MTALHLPSGTCNHRNLIEAVCAAGLADARDTEIKLVFQARTHFSCAALAQLAAWGLDRRRRGCSFILADSARHADLSYVARMDLLRLLAVPYPEPFQRHDPEARFLPLTPVEPGEGFAAAIEAVLAVISQRFAGSEAFAPGLSWLAQELLDNIVNHAASAVPGLVCAQFFPAKHRLDLAIWDAGLGLKATLSPRYPILFSHGDAVTKALEAGVTRDEAVGQGNGLAGCQQLTLANQGELQIWTGNATAVINPKGRSFKLTQQEASLPGTGLLLTLRTNRKLDPALLTFRSDKRLLKRRAPQAHETPAETAVDLRLADENLLGGRRAARSLREQLLSRLQASTTPFVVDFAHTGVLIPSFLDELFGRMVPELGGLEQLIERLELLNISELNEETLNYVLIQRYGEPDGGPVDQADPQPPPEALRSNLPLLVQPDQVLMYMDPDEHFFPNPAWVRALFPETPVRTIGAQTPPAEVLAILRAAQGRLLFACLIRPLPIEEDRESKARTLPAWFLAALAQDSGNAEISMILPETAFRERAAADNLYAHDRLRLLMDLPTQVQPPKTRAFANVLVTLGVSPNGTAHGLAVLKGKTFFEKPADKKHRHDLQKLLTQPGTGAKPFGYRFVWPGPEHDFSYHLDHPQRKQQAAQIQQHLELVGLGDLLCFARRGETGKTGAGVGHPQRVVSLIHLRQLREGGHPPFEERALPAPLKPEFLIRANDLLLSIVAPDTRIWVVCADARLEGLAPSEHLLHLRLKEPTGAEALAEVFNIAWVKDQLVKRHGILPRINRRDVLNCQVPRLDSTLVTKMLRLARFSEKLRAMAGGYDRVRHGLLSEKDIGAQLAHASELDLLGNVIEGAERDFYSFDRQIEMFYPQPLAEA